MRPKISEIGGFRLVREIGRGGFGSVHLGEREDGRRAAVKLLHTTPATDPHFFTLFAREVDAARKVNPFCIAQVLDADPHAEQPWIAVEYIDGPSLSTEIREQGPRSGASLQRLAVATATALTAIHAAGIVHRDLKPSNIMIGPDGPRVIDFGIARAFEEATAFTASGILGTPHYMAPEQLESDTKLTPALDVYSWGAVMVFAAAGRPVFEATRQSALIKAILCDVPDCSVLEEPLRTVVARCLRKDPARRPTARELIDLLTVDPPDPETQGGDEDGGDPTATEPLPTVPAPRPSPGERTPADHTPGGHTPHEHTPAEYTPNGTASPEHTPAEVTPTPPGRRPSHPTGALLFAGRYHSTPGDLAETMQRRWVDARQQFTDHAERLALASWLKEEHPSAAVDTELLRRPPLDADLAVARFVAQARPDLPPVFRGWEMSLPAMAARARSGSAPVAARADVEVMRVMADHHCVEAEHTCSGGRCSGYRTLVGDLWESLTAAGQSAANHNLWLAAFDELVEEPQRVDLTGAPATDWVLTVLLAPDRARSQVERAVERVPRAWRHLVPHGHRDTARAAAAGMGFVTVTVCGVLERLASCEERLRDRLQEWEAHHRRFGVHVAAGILASAASVGLCLALVPTAGTTARVVLYVLVCLLPLWVYLAYWGMHRGRVGVRRPPWMELGRWRPGYTRAFRAEGERFHRELTALVRARGRADTHPFVVHASDVGPLTPRPQPA
ncbi:protein kinase [Nocardiopsis sp. HNM0947]|uniref:Protein kinase n=1 Tax=Nocardiopsis coralli TaxID=2772213 RepID=A0ABR9P6E6_9ACTN|nr:serine/threonine-protein kinase [Nocardiopsis coralli]MBE2999414.1 protein kinase [Nocardiopsis coralli]